MPLTGRDPLRLPLPTAAQVRAAVACPTCGSPAGVACTPRLHASSMRGGYSPGQLPANHERRVRAARAAGSNGKDQDKPQPEIPGADPTTPKKN